ncbi:MAG TPA: DsbA family protein, partial [Sphingomonas sp.]|nr:DsbA family protein [Sphingomonas sp.]
GLLVGRAVPIGEDVGGNPAAAALLADRSVPPATAPAAGTVATLTLVVFTDYQCPACRAADPAMTAAVARDGRVRLVLRDYPIFGARSERAARVAIASARQGIYAAVHHRLMSDRRPLDDTVLREAVESAGGNWATLVADLRRGAGAIDTQLAATQRYAAAIGVAGTPGYVAGSILVVGALDEAGFARLFARARESMPFE